MKIEIDKAEGYYLPVFGTTFYHDHECDYWTDNDGNVIMHSNFVKLSPQKVSSPIKQAYNATFSIRFGFGLEKINWDDVIEKLDCDVDQLVNTTLVFRGRVELYDGIPTGVEGV